MVYSQFSREEWNNAKPDERLMIIKSLEGHLAKSENRKPSEVIPDKLGKYTRGMTSLDGKIIYINEDLLNNYDEPYQAVETLFHEDRHAHQFWILDEHPEVAQSKKQLLDWKINRENYINSANSAYYLAQPIEMDARNTARMKTDALYQNILHDSNYEIYRQNKEKEIEGYKEKMEEELGPNYEEVARKRIYSRNRDMTINYEDEIGKTSEEPMIGITEEMRDKEQDTNLKRNDDFDSNLKKVAQKEVDMLDQSKITDYEVKATQQQMSENEADKLKEEGERAGEKGKESFDTSLIKSHEAFENEMKSNSSPLDERGKNKNATQDEEETYDYYYGL